MEIKYTITKKLQLLLASDNQDAARERTDYLDNEEVSDILLTRDRVRIDSDGKVTMDLTWQLASVASRILYADKAGAASGVVSYKKHYIRDRSVTAEGSTPEFSFLIDSKKNLDKALFRIDDAEAAALREVEAKNKIALDDLPAEIEEYNDRQAKRDDERLKERLAYLERQCSMYQDENTELLDELKKLRPAEDATKAEDDDDYEQAFED